MAGDGEVGEHLHPAGAVEFDARLLGELLAERAGLYAGRPHLALRLDAAGGAVLLLDDQAVVVDVDDHRVQLDLDAHALEAGRGLATELRAERRQDGRRGVEQDHPGLGRVDVAERALEGLVAHLGDLAGQLDTGGAGADDHEGQQLGALGGVVGQLGLLEGAQDPTAQFECVVDGLHAGRVLGEVIVAEVRLIGAGGDDEVVVRGDRDALEQAGGDGLGLEVDVVHVTHEDGGVLLLAQHHAGGRCDLALGDDAGRHLVEHRLEQVVGGLGDQRDIDIGLGQSLGGEQSAEARTDDDHFPTGRGCSSGGLDGGAAHLQTSPSRSLGNGRADFGGPEWGATRGGRVAPGPEYDRACSQR